MPPHNSLLYQVVVEHKPHAAPQTPDVNARATSQNERVTQSEGDAAAATPTNI